MKRSKSEEQSQGEILEGPPSAAKEFGCYPGNDGKLQALEKCAKIYTCIFHIGSRDASGEEGINKETFKGSNQKVLMMAWDVYAVIMGRGFKDDSPVSTLEDGVTNMAFMRL
jgi:hypothetical protein